MFEISGYLYCILFQTNSSFFLLSKCSSTEEGTAKKEVTTTHSVFSCGIKMLAGVSSRHRCRVKTFNATLTRSCKPLPAMQYTQGLGPCQTLLSQAGARYLLIQNCFLSPSGDGGANLTRCCDVFHPLTSFLCGSTRVKAADLKMKLIKETQLFLKS